MFGMSPAQLWANYAVLSALVAAYLFYVGMTSMDPPTWLWIFLAFEGISAIYAGAQAVRQRDT